MTNCKGCGRRIIWGLHNDKPVPLDPAPAVYRVVRHDALGQTIVELESIDPTTHERKAMVSHFATCPEANRFSSRQK